MESIDFSSLTGMQWFWAIMCGIVVGFAKTGISGMGILVVPVFALIFNGDVTASAGILLPILCFADLMAVAYYRRHVEWKYIFPLFPWVAAGVIIAHFIESKVDPNLLKLAVGLIVIVVLIISIVREKQKKEIEAGKVISGFTGMSTGIATMLANAAGPIMNIYFLMMKLPKKLFVGTGAWFFMLVNFFKVPFRLQSSTITMDSFIFDLKLIPAILLGAVLGVITVNKVPEQFFRRAVQVLTFLASAKLIYSYWS